MTEEEALDLLESKRKKLTEMGIKYPKYSSMLGKALIFLTMNYNKEVHWSDVIKYVSTMSGEKVVSVHVRKLWTDYGFNILGKLELGGRKYYKLISLDDVSPKYVLNKRYSKPSVEEFENIKSQYNYTCISCGCKEGEPHPLNPRYITKLEMGHKDPNKNLTADNCIPQCPYCNQRNRDDYIYDNQGGIESINNIKILGKLLDLTKEKEYVKFLIEKHSKEEILRWVNESN